jgi:hypothetical protein
MTYSLISELNKEHNLEPKLKEIIIDFMLELKKKEYETDTNKIKRDLENLKKPIIPMEIKVYEFIKKILTPKDDTLKLITNKISNDEQFELHWKNIQQEFHHKDIDSWNTLNIEYESNIPMIGKIYKKLYLPQNKNLRYCMPSCLIGFYNFSEKPLTIHWSVFITQIEPYSIGTALDNNIPFFISNNQYTDLIIKETSHNDFYILYCWLPKNKKLYQNYWYVNKNNYYMATSGFIQKIDKEDISCFPIPYTLDINDKLHNL